MTLVERIAAIKNDPSITLPEKAARMYEIQKEKLKPVSNAQCERETREEREAIRLEGCGLI